MTKRTLAARLADIKTVEEAVGLGPISSWGGHCHEISLALLRTGLVGKGRVARGTAEKVTSQHSWIVLGDDCYDREATVVDPTAWHYWKQQPYIWTGPNLVHHVPHGAGSIWMYGPPPSAAETGEEVIELAGYNGLSAGAKRFLKLCGPMGYKGWSYLAHGPMGGWPAGEIINAVCETRKLRALVPIDIVGMITDRNPSRLYW